MPNPRNRLKLTGDTHLPDVGDDFDDDQDEGSAGDSAAEPRPMRSIAARAQEAMDTINDYAPVQGYVERARAQVRARPVVALGAAFAVGLLLARI